MQSRGGHRSVTQTREWQQVNRSQLMAPQATLSRSVQELLVHKGHTCSSLLSLVQYLGQSKIWCDAHFVSHVKVACSIATELRFLVHIGMICK